MNTMQELKGMVSVIATVNNGLNTKGPLEVRYREFCISSMTIGINYRLGKLELFIFKATPRSNTTMTQRKRKVRGLRMAGRPLVILVDLMRMGISTSLTGRPS